MDATQEYINAVEAELDDGSRYLHMMAAAYKRHTQLPPDRVALVQETRGDEKVY